MFVVPFLANLNANRHLDFFVRHPRIWAAKLSVETPGQKDKLRHQPLQRQFEYLAYYPGAKFGFGDAACYFCGEQETSEHLLFGCTKASDVWRVVKEH